MKIASWNINSVRVRLPHLLDWLTANPVDVIGLQETKVQDQDFPFDALTAAGWKAVHHGQKSYNGVAILAREELTQCCCGIPAFDDDQRRVIAATVNGLRVVNVYVVNGQTVGGEKYAYKLRWLSALRDYLADELARHPRLVVTGDFNIAPTREDTHDPAIWEGGIFCSEAERAHFQALLDLGLTDCLRACPPAGNHFTWWDYRRGAFRRNLGLRIDHVLASAPLAAQLIETRVDLAPRRLQRPSDHAPVVVEFGAS